MKRSTRVLLSLFAGAVVGHATYTTIRIDSLERRLRNAEAQSAVADVRPPNPNAPNTPNTPIVLSYTPVLKTDRIQSLTLDDRVRRLEDDTRPKMRLLEDSGNR